MSEQNAKKFRYNNIQIIMEISLINRIAYGCIKSRYRKSFK